MKVLFYWLSALFLMVNCSTNKNSRISAQANPLSSNAQKLPSDSNEIINNLVLEDTTFVNLKDYSTDFVYDMRYATVNNFLKTKVYDCAECFLRLKTVKSLIQANKVFMKKGYRIKLYDCYRPLDIQKKMWTIVSNPEYVANPAKGSIHNRGGAVDISLVNSQGKELEMGTTFDFFGKEAAHNYTNLPKKVLKNRILLKTIMIENNFKNIESEWWHYNLTNANKDKISNFKWECE